MITSAIIGELRREYGDEPKSVRLSRQGNGSINLFNVARFPIVEGSYTIKKNTSSLVEGGVSGFTLDLDNGDLLLSNTPANGVTIQTDHKYATWRDKNWNEAINGAIDTLNARGFFRQIVRNGAIMSISANVQTYSGPSACIDLYEILVSDNFSTSGNFGKPFLNWAYQQDANKLVLGNKPTVANRMIISYLRNLQTYSATSATIDILSDWKELVKKKAGANFYRSLAGKIAKQGNASIDEGHFSFSNLRAMANDLDTEFETLSKRKKPTRPAKDIQWLMPTGGVA